MLAQTKIVNICETVSYTCVVRAVEVDILKKLFYHYLILSKICIFVIQFNLQAV